MRLTLLRACHPEPATAVTTLAALLAVGAGTPLWPAIGTTATVAASQLAVGWSNDAMDASRDAAVGRTDKPVSTGELGRRTAIAAAAGATLACAVLALVTAPHAAPIALLGLVSGLFYNWPLKSTALSPLPYAVSFACLPAFVLLVNGNRVPVWIISAGGLLGAGAHFANVVPDLREDAATGVRGLPHRLGAGGALLTSCGLLLVATGLLVVCPPGPPGVPAVIAGALAGVLTLLTGEAVVTGTTGSGRSEYIGKFAFRAILVVVLIDVALLVGAGVVT